MNALVFNTTCQDSCRDHAAPKLLDTLRGFFNHSISQMMAQPRATVHTHSHPCPPPARSRPISIRSGVTRSNAPDRARHCIGKPSRSSTAPTGSQIEAGGLLAQLTAKPLFTHQSFNTCSCAWSLPCPAYTPLTVTLAFRIPSTRPVKRRPVRAFFTRLAHAWRLARGRLPRRTPRTLSAMPK